VIKLCVASVFFLNTDPRAVGSTQVYRCADEFLQDRPRAINHGSGQPLQAGHLHADIAVM
jgi:hypothetical protein